MRQIAVVLLRVPLAILLLVHQMRHLASKQLGVMANLVTNPVPSQTKLWIRSIIRQQPCRTRASNKGLLDGSKMLPVWLGHLRAQLAVEALRVPLLEARRVVSLAARLALLQLVPPVAHRVEHLTRIVLSNQDRRPLVRHHLAMGAILPLEAFTQGGDHLHGVMHMACHHLAVVGNPFLHMKCVADLTLIMATQHLLPSMGLILVDFMVHTGMLLLRDLEQHQLLVHRIDLVLHIDLQTLNITLPCMRLFHCSMVIK